MLIISAVFFSSLLLALLFTPVVGRLARRFNLVDLPSKRKVHSHSIPRIGGVSLFVSFLVPFGGSILFCGSLTDTCFLSPSVPWLLAGGATVFLVGLYDDVHRLSPSIKLAAQIIAGFLACYGGLTFHLVELPWSGQMSLGWFSVPVTVFWFLLVINAINLIDGLDGLAAGVTLFVSLTLLILSISSGNYLVAAGLAGLSGTCMGFLRYNFNPASIFMGDSGSYFLGYMLASLTVLGSMKSQATVAIVIPIVALGLPLMDTIIAPIRRFITGKDLFQPDKSHIHHKLLKMGLTQRKAVLLLYAATIVLGTFALLLVHARNVKAGLILSILGLAVILGFRKLGYLEYLTIDKMLGYLHDITDVMGISRGRRTFLNIQIELGETQDLNELWEGITEACDLLRIDEAKMNFNGACLPGTPATPYTWSADGDVPERHQSVLSLDLPLVDDKNSYGMLHLRKDLIRDPISHYTLRRIEHLRRTVVSRLRKLEMETRGNHAN